MIFDTRKARAAAVLAAALLAPAAAAEGVPRIAEIQAAPDEGPEWIELLNPSDSAVRLDSLFLRRGAKSCRIARDEPLAPGARAVLTADVAAFRELFGPVRIDVHRPACWISLPNSGGALVVAGPDGAALDSAAWGSIPRGTPLRRAEGAETEREGRATPGFDFAPAEGPDTLAFARAFLARGEALVGRLRLAPGSRLSWEMRTLRGRLCRSGGEEGPFDALLRLRPCDVGTEPLFVRWSLLPSGRKGSLRAVVGR